VTYQHRSIKSVANVCFARFLGTDHGQLESVLPVAWSAMAVRHGQDQDGSF
jgi:hypothetical protein